jgi:hypothetical protein
VVDLPQEVLALLVLDALRGEAVHHTTMNTRGQSEARKNLALPGLTTGAATTLHARVWFLEEALSSSARSPSW